MPNDRVPPARWIRLNADWADSAWIMDLDVAGQLAWIKLLCRAKLNGVDGALKALPASAAAKVWGVPECSVVAMLEAATSHGALMTRDGVWLLSGWNAYQKPDPTTAERSRRYRERHAVTTRDGA